MAIKRRSDSELYNLIARSEYIYSRQLCFSQCYQRHVLHECNCSDWFFVSLFENYSTCSIEQIRCANNFFYSTYIANNFKYVKEVCLPVCPLECFKFLFKTASISHAQLVGDYFLEYIQNNSRLASDFENRSVLDAASARDSFVKVDIYYESLSYAVSTESPQMNLISLLASIGGNLSLFLGVSVFSLFELMEVNIMIWHILFSKK